MLKFLADENISPLTASLVKKLGYDILELENVGLVGKSDIEIASFARKQKRMILTFDLDFGEIYYSISTEYAQRISKSFTVDYQLLTSH